MALDEPKTDDEIVTINEITVAVDPRVKSNIEGLTLDRSGDKENFALLGDTGQCC